MKEGERFLAERQLRGGQRHFQGELWSERTYGERKGTWGEESRDRNAATNSMGPFPGLPGGPRPAPSPQPRLPQPTEAAGVHQARALPTPMHRLPGRILIVKH